MSDILVGIDTGGTFTDFVCIESGEIRIHKVLSDPHHPDRAILQGLDDLNLTKDLEAGRVRVIHGTTVATNAALERKGVKTLFITNRGFTDLLTIGRQARKQLYNLCPIPQTPPVPTDLCVGVDTRVNAQGQEIKALDVAEVTQLVEQLDPDIQAVAVCLLFSYLNNEAELQLESALQDKVKVSISSRVLPEYREYERAMATWLNASLSPIVASYLDRLEQKIPSSMLAVMQSSGGTISASQASDRAVDLLLSGPAGGLAAARQLCIEDATPRLLTLDMGGTSTDVAVVDGEVRLTTEGSIGDFPVAVPMVDMHTIGAGGGSIAYLDEGGMLHVGPQSAGADPGPVCYGRGGKKPTVTDAHLCIGTLPSRVLLGGSLRLDELAARQAVAELANEMGLPSIEHAAAGIIELANQHMVQALRYISEQRGHDPQLFTLCSFGGAGGLHVCDLAELLGMKQALVPSHAGIFSALGMLVAPRVREMSQTIQRPYAQSDPLEIEHIANQLLERGQEELVNEGAHAEEISAGKSVDCRYHGQSFTLNIPLIDWQNLEAAFHQRHEALYGHRLDREVELVTLRLSLRAPGAELKLPEVAIGSAEADSYHEVWLMEGKVPFYKRDTLGQAQSLDGPALIGDSESTVWIKPGWKVDISVHGHLALSRQ